MRAYRFCQAQPSSIQLQLSWLGWDSFNFNSPTPRESIELTSAQLNSNSVGWANRKQNKLEASFSWAWHSSVPACCIFFSFSGWCSAVVEMDTSLKLNLTLNSQEICTKMIKSDYSGTLEDPFSPTGPPNLPYMVYLRAYFGAHEDPGGFSIHSVVSKWPRSHNSKSKWNYFDQLVVMNWKKIIIPPLPWK